METNYDAVKGLVDNVVKGLVNDGGFSCEVDPEVYHAAKRELKRKLKCPVVSKSLLLDFMKDPYGSRWRELEEEKKDSEALRKGALIDCLTLTPELAGDLYVVGKADRRTKAGKARIAELEVAGKTIVAPEEYEGARKVAMLAREELKRVLMFYKTQVACWALLEEVDGVELPCKVILTGMFDVLGGLTTISPIVDLKTTSRSIVSETEVNKNMAEFGYGIQAAVYSDLAALVLGEGRPFRFFYVSLTTPVRMRWVDVNACDIELYRARYYRGLMAYAESWAGNNWGGAVLPDMVYEVPAWDAKRGTECVAEKGGEV